MIIDEARPLVFEYLNMPLEEKESRIDFRKKHGISSKQFERIRGEWVYQRDEVRETTFLPDPRRDVVKQKPIKVDELAVQDIENYDSDKWLRERTPETDKALINACKSGNAQALKLYFQITNRLIEKQEIKIGLTADEIARRNLEAERRLREGGYRVEDVS